MKSIPPRLSCIPNYLLIAVVFFSVAASATAQPVISSVSPSSGAVGSSVTVTGANFSPSLPDNVVYFGPVRAVVSGATSASLTVTVPPGANYAPVSVTVDGLTAQSTVRFTPTFRSSGVIDASTFATRIDYQAPGFPYWVSVGDIDGDGKSDLLSAGSNNNATWVYRNATSLGNISSSSFSPNVEFPVAWGDPRTISAVDLDGDGKLDVLFDIENFQ